MIEVNLIRCFPVRVGVWAPVVVKTDVSVKPCPCCRHGVVGVQVNFFVFRRTPKPFHKHVVAPANGIQLMSEYKMKKTKDSGLFHEVK